MFLTIYIDRASNANMPMCDMEACVEISSISFFYMLYLFNEFKVDCEETAHYLLEATSYLQDVVNLILRAYANSA